MSETSKSESPSTFHDLQAYQQLPRLAGLVLSPDGTRLITSVAALDPEGTRFRPSLWEIDPAGEHPARRLTRGPKGESSPAFTPAGDLLFTSARPDAESKDQPADAPAALWCLPPSGEARVVGTRPGGVGGPVVARDAGTIVVTSMTLPAAVTGEDDEARRKERKDKKVSAILHTGYPVRNWDHDIGPDEPRLLAGTLSEDGPVTWQDLTPIPGTALHDATVAISPDGTTVVSGWMVPEPGGSVRSIVVTIDVATGAVQPLADEPGFEFFAPSISPDGQHIVCYRESVSTPTTPPDNALVMLPIGGGPARELTAGWDRWPGAMAWTPDSAALIVVADSDGRAPAFRLDLDGDGPATITRLTGDHGAYSDPQVSPDGASVYLLRSAVDSTPTPVRIDARTPDQQPVALLAPSDPGPLPGTLTEVQTTAADGTPLRAWLVLPDGASESSPAPLLLWIHGGPLGSWNAWQWRWCPWLMAARGYAVLLPDPALSTGYGLDFIARGWGQWGAAPYTDLLALTDATVARSDIDADRTAAMGGSFGGYMANWVAGHTDRFSAIVTHASLWDLEGFGATTDFASYWAREMTAEMAAANSPHHSVDAITTPTLVIHGDKDYRVPIGEALHLWWDLVSRHGGDPADLPHRFLYFPDENHWILTPGNAIVWYQTVSAFLDQHVLGKDWETPELLR